MKAIVKTQFQQLEGIFDVGDEVEIKTINKKGSYAGYRIKSKNGHYYSDSHITNAIGYHPLSSIFKAVSEHRVFIEWEHGDANKKTIRHYDFESREETLEFLNFIFDLRKWSKGRGYENLGHFEDGHYEREEKWVLKVDQKHGNKFADKVEIDVHYKNKGYRASVEHIWLEINGVKHYIVWTKARKSCTLPNKGGMCHTTIGNINGYGADVFGGKDKDYERFDYLSKLHKGDGSKIEHYPKVSGKVIDCRPSWYIDKKKGEPSYNFDWTSFHYILLLEGEGGSKFTIEIHGYDKNYEKKYGRNHYEGIKMFEV